MRKHSAAIFQRDNFSQQIELAGMELTPLSWEADDQTGPRSALVLARGSEAQLLNLRNRLRCGVRITSAGGYVWEGMIWSVDIDQGYRRRLYSLADVANRVKALYLGWGDEALESQETDWVEDTVSQGFYGIRERQISVVQEATPSQALRAAETELAIFAYPNPIPQTPSGKVEAIIECVGLFKELDYRYHLDDPGGRTEYNPGGEVDHVFGWRVEDTSAGFSDNGDGDVGGYSSFDGKLPPGAVNSQFKVVSSLNNDNTYTIVERSAEEVQTWSTDEDLAGFRGDFSSGSQYVVEERKKGLGFLKVGQQIDIDITTDATGMDNMETWAPDWEMEGLFNIRETGGERVKVDGRTNTWDQGGVRNHPKEADGWLHGTLTAAAMLTVSPKPGADELQQDATNFIVTTVGERVAQRVLIPSGAGGPLWKIGVILRKVGSPADTVKVSLYSDVAEAPGTLLDSGTIAAADVLTSNNLCEAVMDAVNDVTISDATYYHIVIERTGVHDPDNYWILGIVEDDGEDSLYEEAAKYWNGATWSTRPTDSSVPFRIWTGVDAAVQIQTLLGEYATNIAACDVQAEAGELVSPYADGKQRVGEIVRSLLEVGTEDGARLILEMLPDRRMLIKAQPDSTVWKRLQIGLQGRIETAQGSPTPLGSLYYGEWAVDVGAPPQSAQTGAESPVYLAWSKYSAPTQKHEFGPANTPNIYDAGYRDG